MTREYLALDLGASSGRLIKGHYSCSQKILGLQEQARIEHQALRGASGHLEWQLARIVAWIYDELGNLSCGPPNYCSIGLDSWAVDYVLLDRKRQLLAPPYSYRDERTQGVYEELALRINFRELYQRTGAQFMEPNTLCQLWAVQRDEPQVLEQARYFLMIPDYLAFELCGAMANEPTNASTSQLYSFSKQSWDFALIEQLGLPSRMFGQLLPVGSVLAPRLKPGLAKGSLAGCGVVQTASHDTASAVMAIPFQESAEHAKLFLSSGTWSVMGYELDEPVTSTEARGENFANALGYGGHTLFLKSLCGLWLLQELQRELRRESGIQLDYARLEELARQAGPGTVLFPVGHPDLLRPGNIPGKIIRLCIHFNQQLPQTFGRDLATDLPIVLRSIYDSLAMEYRSCYEALQRVSSKSAAVMHIVGGGAQSALLNQLCADSLGIPVQSGPLEAAAMGNILAQVLADGAVSGCQNLTDARSIVRNSFAIRTFSPRQNSPAAYQRYQAMQNSRELAGTDDDA